MRNPARLFTSKSEVGWSDPSDPYHPSTRLGERLMPYVNYFLFSDSPLWNELKGFKPLMHSFHHNPIHNAVVNLKAREYSNMKIGVWNKRKQMLEPRTSKKPLVSKLYKMWDRPNCTQSTWEFLQQWKIFYETCGNAFSYANSPIGFKPTWETTQALWNPWPEYMKYQLTGKYFDALEISDIIKGWEFEYGKYKKTWTPQEIFHRNRPNTKIQDGLIFGQSAAEPLYRPLSNIQMAYESRNVLMKNRGMRAIISSAAGDATGKIPLQQHEKDEVDKEIKNYGMLSGQRQFFFSNYPLDVKTFDQDVFKLGLFEEIATDAMIVAIAHGVPEVLVKLYVKGATFENQEASVRRLYQGALIPEALDDMMAWSSFLGLDDTDFCLIPLFDHIVALQESEERKANVDGKLKETAMKEVAAGLLLPEEYREMFGRPPLPTAETSDVAEEETDEEDKVRQLYIEKYIAPIMKMRYGKAA